MNLDQEGDICGSAESGAADNQKPTKRHLSMTWTEMWIKKSTKILPTSSIWRAIRKLTGWLRNETSHHSN
jgi:hypothetical protein